jgi:ParB family transcriptional regulator, chromosome partitioning protein
MTKTEKITLATTRDIPFNKLVLSQSNIRTIKNGESIEQLAQDIAHRGLLQSLSVRPINGADGAETGMYEVPAGGRRYRALELLVRQKRLAKTAPVPCIVKADGLAEEDSLAENTQREALHPVDQFRAFKALIDKGLSEEEIAARFFVTPTVVRQRLRLAAVSEQLIDAYVAGEMKLEQLMAFTLTPDHARQEQVWQTVKQSWNREPYYIRRLLTEGAVSASDRRALLVGLEAYEQAGGIVTRDLFQDDEGGWLQDPALLDQLAAEKLKEEAAKLAAEGWKWIAASIDFPYGHKQGLRRLAGAIIGMTEEEEAARAAVIEEFDRVQAEYEDADELPDEIDQRLGELEEMIERFDNRPVRYDPADIARAGVFISLDRDGDLLIERGYVKPEDEAPAASASGGGTAGDTAGDGAGDSGPRVAVITIGGEDAEAEDEGEQGLRPLSDRLVAELTAHRTLALRDAVAQAPAAAFRSVLHALCLAAFYRFAGDDNCMEISAKSEGFTAYAQALKDSAPAQAIQRRHEEWQARLPGKPAALWDALAALDEGHRAALFAHCASLTVNVAREPWNRRPDGLLHGEQLGRAVNLDMVAAGWKPTVDNYLGRVPKARILEAVREGRDERSAQLIDHLKKGEMAREAERLLDGTGWLPEPLRPAEPEGGEAADGGATESSDLPEFLAGDDGEASDTETADEEPAAAE